ncbi:N-acetylgalactosamine-N, N'-diacetylbacillosaminyl-diphospho-undecaprenol 4-alpha-N-acetylgalactosaminyltransferase [Gammaproteobacteria bacterium]
MLHDTSKEWVFYLPDLNSGGTERVFLRLAVGLQNVGYQPVFLVDREEGALLPVIQNSGIPVECLHAPRTLSAFFPLLRWLRRRQPAALLSGITHNNCIAALAGWYVNCRVIVSEHTLLSEQIALHPSWQYRVLPFFCRVSYSLATARVTVGMGVADDLSKVTGLPRASLTVIPNPVVTADFWERAQAPAPHPWLLGTSPIWVAAGRLVPLKDFPTLIRAFWHVHQKISGARLLIFGEGPERDHLIRLCAELNLEDSVALPGFIEDPIPAFARATAVVVSSRFEGFGLTLVEAMACGTSVVSTDSVGPREILQDGKLGPLVPPGDTEALAQAMINLQKNLLPKEIFLERVLEYRLESVVQRYLNSLRRPHPLASSP